MFDTLRYYGWTFIETGFAIFGMRGMLEQPRYTVRQDLGAALEIRDYADRVAVETTVSAASEDAASRQAFSRLFAYITGANSGSVRIAMTAPVQSLDARRIAMTAPVQVVPEQGGVTMRFFLPAAVAANPPQPTDPAVRIVREPPATVAALRFSGTPAQAAGGAHELLDRLAGSRWQAVGAPYLLGYDPPFAIPWLRRNEVAVEVRQAEAT